MASIGVTLVPVIATAHEFKRGDRVLIAVRDSIAPDEMERIKTALQDEFEGVTFVLVAGLRVEGVESQ